MKKSISIFIMISAFIGGINSLSAQNFINITKIDTNKTKYLDTNQVLVLTLPANPSTGYGWYVASIDSNVLVQSGDRENAQETANRKVGQPGNQVFRFVGVSAGSTKIKLEYKRQWEKNKFPAQGCSFAVVSAGKYSGTYTPPVKPDNIKN